MMGMAYFSFSLKGDLNVPFAEMIVPVISTISRRAWEY